MEFNYPVAIPWVIFGLSVFLLLLLAVAFVFAFKSSKEWALFPSFITISGLTVALLCSFLIPVDIFSVSQILDPLPFQLPIRIIYYSVFLLLLIYATAVVPFAYFWYEESDVRARVIHTNTNTHYNFVHTPFYIECANEI